MASIDTCPWSNAVSEGTVESAVSFTSLQKIAINQQVLLKAVIPSFPTVKSRRQRPLFPLLWTPTILSQKGPTSVSVQMGDGVGQQIPRGRGKAEPQGLREGLNLWPLR